MQQYDARNYAAIRPWARLNCKFHCIPAGSLVTRVSASGCSSAWATRVYERNPAVTPMFLDDVAIAFEEEFGCVFDYAKGFVCYKIQSFDGEGGQVMMCGPIEEMFVIKAHGPERAISDLMKAMQRICEKNAPDGFVESLMARLET